MPLSFQTMPLHTMAQWRMLPPMVLPGADNMALDDACATLARDNGEVIARVYGWTRPTLSFGRHQRSAGLYDRGAAQVRGIDVVRRPTGGRSVLHWREITYCVAAPEEALGALRQSYELINSLLVSALRMLSVEACVATPASRTPRPGPGACFEEPVAGEIVAAERKLVGSAQRRGDGAFLQHGSILVEDDQAMAAALRTESVSPPAPAATLRSLIGYSPTLEEFDAALAAAIEAEFGSAPVPLPFNDEIGAALDARRAHYLSEGWTWRR
jgi:lipoate-protein ligase A